MDRLARYVPLIATLRNTTAEQVRGDLSAGVTAAVMLVPQAMALAMMAGLDPIVGLYASVAPLVVYGVLGTSRQLAIGPVAILSLLVASAAAELAEPGTPEYLGIALAVSLVSGLIQVALGFLRVGMVVEFLSHPVVSGFTMASALIIGASQLGTALGIQIPRSHHFHETVWRAIEGYPDWNWPTIGLTTASLAALWAGKKWFPRFPRFLAVVVVGTAAVPLLGLQAYGVKVVGEVPAGLPGLTLPPLGLQTLQAVLPMSITIAMVGFLESISVAKNQARKHKYDLDADQELIALGASNVAAAFTGGYPVTGGFSRTALNEQAGARTTLAGIFTAVFVALTLLFLTPLFQSLPNAVLAAIILISVVGLFDLHEVTHLWKVSKPDLALMALTFFATLGLGVEEGIGVGVLASLGWFVKKVAKPHVAALGHLPGTDVYRNLKRNPDARPVPGLLLVRFDAPLFYANASHLKSTLRELEATRGEPLRAVVLDGKGIGDVDASADAALHEVLDAYRNRGIDLWLAGFHGPVLDVLDRSGFLEKLGRDRVVRRVHDAVTALTAPQPIRAVAR